MFKYYIIDFAYLHQVINRLVRTWILSQNNLYIFNPLSANSTKWSNILKQFVAKLPTNCLSVIDHFVGFSA